MSRIEATLLDRAAGALAFQKEGLGDRLDRNDETERRADTGRLNGRAAGLVALVVLAGLSGRGGTSGGVLGPATGGLWTTEGVWLFNSLVTGGDGDLCPLGGRNEGELRPLGGRAEENGTD